MVKKGGGITIFRHVGSSQIVKLLTNVYLIYQLIWEYTYKYIFVKIARSKLSELSNFLKFKFYFYYGITSLLILNTAIFFKSNELYSNI